MNKDFDDFMKLCNNKDWSPIIKHLSETSDTSDIITTICKANLEITMTVLREYHDWLNPEDTLS